MIDCQVVGVPESLLTRLGFTVDEFKEAQLALGPMVAQAKKRIAQALDRVDASEACVGHSGGKDSVLVRWLTDANADVPNNYAVWSFHNPKVEGPNAVHEITQRFLYSMPNALVVYKWSPTDLGFKLQIDGTRKYEATRNDGRSTDFVRSGASVPRTELTEFVKDGLFGMSFCYPIFDWTDLQVWAAIERYSIPYSREYLSI